MSRKLRSGSRFPEFTLPRAGGGELHLGGARDSWLLVVVYRGRHCPLSKRFLDRLDGMREDFVARNIEIAVISADPRDQAEADVQEFGWSFALGYDLSVEAMRTLGTYISEPQPQEGDRPFSEPALFVVTPDGTAQIVAVSNAPFALPDLGGVLSGLTFIQNRGYPPRGTLD